jgi:lipopolysaccharide transport system permease protein
LPYVALGLWPWMCFSEGLQRGTTAIIDHSGLLGKIALPAELLVLASVAATFSLHALGLAAIVVVLSIAGYPIEWQYSWILLPLLLLLFCLTIGLSLISAALQVYVRDVAQVLTQSLSFMFFLTPILYTPTMLPPAVRDWLVLNPVSIYCQTAREWLLFGQTNIDWRHGVALLVAASVLFSGILIFRKFERHFEDFL